jgi:ATP-dependent helicase/nuclease subunit A
VVPVCGDAPIEGCSKSTALYPLEGSKRLSCPAFGCPEFGEDSVLDRGVQGTAPSGGSVRPGLHKPRAGTHSVVWWDRRVLALGLHERMGLRQQGLLEADEHGTNVALGEWIYSRWKQTRCEAVAMASRPSIAIQTVTVASKALFIPETRMVF